MLLRGASTRFQFPQNPVCCVLHNGCETPELFALLSSMNRVLAKLAYHRCSPERGNTEAGGEAKWKNQKNLYQVSGWT